MAHNHYYLNDDEQTNLIIKNPKLLYTGIVCDDPNWSNKKHWHPFLELLYMQNGTGKAVINGIEYNLKEGDLIILNPGVVHAESFSPNTPANLIFLAVENIQIQNLPPCCLIGPNDCPIINLRKYKYKVENYFSELINETSSQINLYKQMCDNLLEALFILILRILITNHIDENNDSNKICTQIKDYIDKNYTQTLSLDALSGSLYISKSHLSHVFKSETGSSPIKYLINKRIEKACHLLLETNLSISEIAVEVGYSDPVYFSQMFKRTKGMSPKQYKIDNLKTH